jgi:predicted ThiF/HesA family dinucleotide-utilizing enzyme
MGTFEYTIDKDKIKFIRAGTTESNEYNSISIMYDDDDAILLKHGSSEKVEEYFANFIQKLVNGKNGDNDEIVDEMITATKIITVSKDTILQNPEILNDINNTLAIPGYVTKFAKMYGE